MTDNDCIILAGGNAGAEFLSVLRLKVLFRSDKNIRGGIQPKELRGPLFNQVVGNDKKGFLAEAEALALHGSGHHFIGLARANLMG